MSQPFIGEIKQVAFNFAQRDWAKCEGQLIPISENAALFSLIGTNFGGDGRSTVGLPDLRGRTPVSIGNYVTNYATFFYDTGTKGGNESVTLTLNQMPAHTHQVYGTEETADSAFIHRQNQTDNAFASNTTVDTYGPPSNVVALNPNSMTSFGGGQPHTNIQPSAVLNFTIALLGLYPQRN